MSKTDKAVAMMNRYGRGALQKLVAARTEAIIRRKPVAADDYKAFATEVEWLVRVAIAPSPTRLIVTCEKSPCDTLLVTVKTLSEDGRECVARRQLDDRPGALTEGLNDALNRNVMCRQFLAATPWLWDNDGVRAPVGQLPKFALLDAEDLVDMLSAEDAVNMCPWKQSKSKDPNVKFDLIKVTRKVRLGHEKI